MAGIVLAVTLLVLPWELYLRDADAIAGYLSGSWNGSAWRFPVLIPPTLLALWILRRNGAEWLVVPAVWPATQFYYVSMALPAVVGRPILAAALALPVPLMTPIAVIALAAITLRRHRRAALPVAPG